MGHPTGSYELRGPQLRAVIDAREIARIAYQHHGAAQRIDELAEAIRTAAACAPRVIVEIGCDAGGTLFCWRQLCADVFGVTLAANTRETGGQGPGHPLVDHGATVLLGDSHAPAVRSRLVELLAGRAVDVLHIDGDHSYDGVAADFAAYSPLVRPGGLVLVHDVLNPYDSRVDVPRWWAEVSVGRQASVIASRQSRPIGFGVLVMEESSTCNS